MTSEDRAQFAAWISSVDDGTPSGKRIAAYLRGVLINRPDDIVEETLTMLNMDNPVRRQCERLYRSKAVTERTPFADLPGILDADRQVQKFNRERDGN
jgi:hypothetical protein